VLRVVSKVGAVLPSVLWAQEQRRGADDGTAAAETRLSGTAGVPTDAAVVRVPRKVYASGAAVTWTHRKRRRAEGLATAHHTC